jgi:hypothetical protein
MNAKRCKKHKFSYDKFCWFCFCKFLKKPHDFAYYGGYNPKLLEAFLKEHPLGKL